MNTNDPIEELFRDNQHGLDEKPRDLLWDRIEERLDEKSVQKKKTEWWKYATAASVVIGMVIGVWALLNNQDSLQKESMAPQIVYEKTIEVNEENASEILDKLEEQKQSVVIKSENKAVPEITASEQEAYTAPSKAEQMPAQTPYDDAFDLEKPVPIAEMKAAEPVESAKEEVLVFRGATPEKKDGNYILGKKSESAHYELQDERRLGNMAEKSVSYEEIQSDSIIVNQFYVKTANLELKYKLISRTKDSVVYVNPNVDYPSKIILIQDKNDNSLIYEGDQKHQNSELSKEIQKYVNENKHWIFSQIAID